MTKIVLTFYDDNSRRHPTVIRVEFVPNLRTNPIDSRSDSNAFVARVLNMMLPPAQAIRCPLCGSPHTSPALQGRYHCSHCNSSFSSDQIG